MHRRKSKRLPLVVSATVLLAVTVLLTAAGCRLPVASMIVSSPNRINPLVSPQSPLPPVEKIAGVDQQFRVTVGPPEASLSVSVIEPKGEWAGESESKPSGDRPVPKGTVLVLHGIYARSLWMTHTAHRLAEAGYRAVLVDLRGHGASTGKYLTYGVREAADLSQVIDALYARGLVAGRLGVYGVSYGATTSIHLAGRDPRVQAVVAVEPFGAMREEVPHFGRVMAPGVGLVIPEETYQEAVDLAANVAEFKPEEADAAVAIQRTQAPVLIIHGTSDWVVPHKHGQRLYEAGRDHTQLELIPRRGHTALWLDPTGEITEKGRKWFDRFLYGQRPADSRQNPGRQGRQPNGATAPRQEPAPVGR